MVARFLACYATLVLYIQIHNRKCGLSYLTMLCRNIKIIKLIDQIQRIKISRSASLWRSSQVMLWWYKKKSTKLIVFKLLLAGPRFIFWDNYGLNFTKHFCIYMQIHSISRIYIRKSIHSRKYLVETAERNNQTKLSIFYEVDDKSDACN